MMNQKNAHQQMMMGRTNPVQMKAFQTGNHCAGRKRVHPEAGGRENFYTNSSNRPGEKVPLSKYGFGIGNVFFKHYFPS